MGRAREREGREREGKKGEEQSNGGGGGGGRKGEGGEEGIKKRSTVEGSEKCMREMEGRRTR